MLAAAALVRAPLAGGGFGSDPDSWRNVVAALHSLDAGRYIPSRVPGFPVFEALLAGLAPFGPYATNSLAIVAGLACIVLFARLLESYRVPAPVWPLIGFAFAPPLAVEAAQTMDYAFGLAFFLAAWLAVKRGHPLLAGLMLAAATGCRPTYALAHLAFLARFAVFRAPFGRWLRYFAGAVPLTILLFLPVLLAPEARDLERHLTRHVTQAHVTPENAQALARHALRFLLGSFGGPLLVLGLIAAAWVRWRRPKGAHASPIERAAEGAFAAALGIGIGGFWLLIPYSAAYLLPLLPLLLVGIARTLPVPATAAVMLAIALETVGGFQYRPPRLVPGALAVEFGMRRDGLEATRALVASAPGDSAVRVVGREAVHRLLVLDRSLERLEPAWAPFEAPGVALRARSGRLAYAASLTPAQRDSLERAGWRVERVAP